MVLGERFSSKKRPNTSCAPFACTCGAHCPAVVLASRTVVGGAKGHRRAASPTPLPLRFRGALQGRDGLIASSYTSFRGPCPSAVLRAGASVAIPCRDAAPFGSASRSGSVQRGQICEYLYQDGAGVSVHRRRVSPSGRISHTVGCIIEK
jgi:hypothetical protein